MKSVSSIKIIKHFFLVIFEHVPMDSNQRDLNKFNRNVFQWRLTQFQDKGSGVRALGLIVRRTHVRDLIVSILAGGFINLFSIAREFH